VGEALHGTEGSHPKVAAVKHLKQRTKVYNFEVETVHTYYVGSHPLLVHNAGCGGGNLVQGEFDFVNGDLSGKLSSWDSAANAGGGSSALLQKYLSPKGNPPA